MNSCLILFCGLLLGIAPEGDKFTDREFSAIATFLQRTMTNANAGMVVGLVDERGSRVCNAGKLGNDIGGEVNGDTVFEIGSVTKVFTALLAVEMDRRGELKLDDPVRNYLPERVSVPAFQGSEITFRSLAAQDSGLPFHPESLEKVLDWYSGKPSLKEFKAASDAYTAENLYAFLMSFKLTNAPGTQFQYSNVGMSLLGHAMALRAGESYESLLIARIGRPLNLKDTRVTVTAEQKPRLAQGHWADGTPAENLKFQVNAGAGGIVSTVNDLLKFLSANLGLSRTELTPLMKQMQVVRHTGVTKFGSTAMPWFDEGIYQPPGSEILGHGGGGLGYLAFVGFDKKKRRGVAVLSNQLVINPAGIGWTILQGMPLSSENITYFVLEIIGIGMALQADKLTGQIRIGSVYPKSPAGEAGLRAGLIIDRINDASVERKTVQDCLEMIKGPAGTKVRFHLINPERKETNEVELARQKFVTSIG